MKRREFITVLGGAALTWPLAARAQQTPRMRRVGVLIPFPDDRGPLVKDNLSAFKQRLHELGWDEGRNIRFDYRFTGQVPDRMRAGSEELIALAPDIIVVWANPAAAIVRKATQAIPIIFVNVSDPVGVQTWRVRAETSRASRISRQRLAESGCKCSRKSRPECAA